MGSNNSTLSRIPNADVLMQETGFTPAHIIRLYDRFETLDSDKKGYLSQKDFESIKALALNPIGDRIIGAFFTAGREGLGRKCGRVNVWVQDTGSDVTIRQETVDFHSFVRILAHFRPVDKSLPRDPEAINSRTNKLRFAFQLYDQDRDGKISRAELLQVLRMMMEMQVTEEQLDSIVDRSFMESDLDGDDGISFDEFRKSLDRLNIDHKMSIRFLR